MYTALYRVYRPRRFADVVGQEHVTRTLLNALRTGRVGHAYLFSGPRGTGKTSLAKLLARAVNCQAPEDGEPCGRCSTCTSILEGRSVDVLEVDAASNRGIDEVRALRERALYTPVEGKYKVYIIDEVHMLTAEAMAALLKTLEEPPAYMLFLLATTEPDRLSPTILSRCQRFALRRLRPGEIVQRLEAVARDIGLAADPEALATIARRAEGGMRDALALLDQCAAYTDGVLTRDQVLAVVGGVAEEDMARLVQLLADKDAAGVISWVEERWRNGAEPRQVLRDVTDYLHRGLLASVRGDPEGPALPWPVDAVVRHLEVLARAEARLRLSTEPQLELELALLSLFMAGQEARLDAMAQRLAALEEKVSAWTGGRAPAASPAPPRPAPAAPASPPAPEAATGEDVRSRAMELLRMRNKVTAAILEKTRWEREGNTIKIYFMYDNHRAMASAEEILQIIRNAIRQVVGSPVQVMLLLDERKGSGRE